MIILTLNPGSSSLKFAVYDIGGEHGRPLASAAIDRIGTGEPQVHFKWGGRDTESSDATGFSDHRGAVEHALQLILNVALPPVQGVGIRLVHGGPDRTAPAPVDQALIDYLDQILPLAPLHLPGGLACLAAARKALPDIPQVACFDTGFHTNMPDVARHFPLPRHLWREGVRRYGFHGLSCEYVMGVLGPDSGRVVIAHLGNGASLTAVRDGRSVDTTMGFTPAGGIMMGTRSGDIDPGVLLHLLRSGSYDLDGLEHLINHNSGLKGVSGVGADMRVLLETRDRDPDAALAVDLFCFQARKSIGALTAVLGGLDRLVFTGGIGEHAAPVRSQICEGLEHLGVVLDSRANTDHAETISRRGTGCRVSVIPAQEDLVIARHTAAFIAGH